MMRRLAALVFATLAALASPIALAAAAAPGDGNDAVHRWTGVDVVMQDSGQIADVRAATGIQPGDSMAYSDPRLRTACAQVRARWSAMTVRCQAINNGSGESMYVVELAEPQAEASANANFGAPPGRASCSPAPLAPDLAALAARVAADRQASLAPGGDSDHREFVNANQYLDHYTPKLHLLDQQYHEALRGRQQALVDGTASCDARSRADAVFMLNFLGDAATAVRLTAPLTVDADERVRNNALRLIGTFADHVDRTQAAILGVAACGVLQNQIFTDQNKSLMMLHDLLRTHAITADDIAPDCQRRVADIARHSNSDQRGGPARFILAALGQQR
jgi:hypothetical protein